MGRPRTEFGRRLRRLVSETGTTDVEFADHVGVNISTLKSWMSGETMPKGMRELYRAREETGLPWSALSQRIPEKMWTVRRAVGCEWEDLFG